MSINEMNEAVEKSASRLVLAINKQTGPGHRGLEWPGMKIVIYMWSVDIETRRYFPDFITTVTEVKFWRPLSERLDAFQGCIGRYK